MLLLPNRHRHLALVLLALLVLPAFASCRQADIPPLVAPVPGLEQPLDQAHTVGQTFVAHHAGLDAIDVFLQPHAAATGEVVLHLYAGPHTDASLATASISAADISQPAFYRFSLTPLPASRQHDYYMVLELAGTGRLMAGAAPGAAYLDGAMYQNGAPLDAQLAFRPGFDGMQRTMGFMTEVLPWWGALLLGGLWLYVLPGYALLVLLWREAGMLAWAERLALAAGLGAALYPLLVLLSHVPGLHLGAAYAWIPPPLGLALLVWWHRRLRPGGVALAWRAWLHGPTLGADAALLLVLALVVITRFAAVDALVAPMWADSYHHTVIARLLVEHGGVFNAWQPYANLDTMTYHFGAHTLVAVFHWFSGVDMPQAMLWVGQFLNVLAVLAVYPLATRLGGNRWAGIAAVLLAGLLSPMPMFYVNWGRYTQLAGQVLLPVVVYLSWQVLEQQRRDWRLLALVCLALSGLALTHYRVLLFALAFFPAFLLLALLSGQWRAALARLLWLGVGCTALVLPWFLHVLSGKIPTILAGITAASAAGGQRAAAVEELNSVGSLLPFLPVGLWLLLPVCVGWGLWRRNRGVALVSVWWFLVLLGVNPQWVGLPGAGTITNFALVMAAYMPAAMLIGAAAGWLAAAAWLARFQVALLALVGVLAVWGATQRPDDRQLENYVLATHADRRAAAWVAAHTAPQAQFLVSWFFVNEVTLAGADGGWWLPILAQRNTTLPPMLYISEQGAYPGYTQHINELANTIEAYGVEHPTTLAMLRERAVTHVYIGQRQGSVGRVEPALRPETLLASPFFAPVYHEDRVWIFEVMPEAYESVDQT